MIAKTTENQRSENQRSENQRIDIWLWQARFFKSRSLSTKICRAGKVRLNDQKITKAGTTVAHGDVLNFPQIDVRRIVRILALSVRRGPAPEAAALYQDMTPPPETVLTRQRTEVARREKGAGRPTKSDRRAIDRLRHIYPE